MQRGVFQPKDELFAMSQQKVTRVLKKVPTLAIFDYLGPASKSIFSTYRQIFEKALASFLVEVVDKVLSVFGFPFFEKMQEVLQVDFFLRP